MQLNLNVCYVAGYGAQAGGYGGRGTKGNGDLNMKYWVPFGVGFDGNMHTWTFLKLVLMFYVSNLKYT